MNIWSNNGKWRLYIGGNKKTSHSYKDCSTLHEVTINLWAYAKSGALPEEVWWLAGLDGWENNKDLFSLDVPENIKLEVDELVKELDTLAWEEG